MAKAFEGFLLPGIGSRCTIDPMNKFNTPAHIQIKSALAKHEADMKAVPIFSPQYYYAQGMIVCCKDALKLSDPIAAWKHFIGATK